MYVSKQSWKCLRERLSLSHTHTHTHTHTERSHLPTRVEFNKFFQPVVTRQWGPTLPDIGNLGQRGHILSLEVQTRTNHEVFNMQRQVFTQKLWRNGADTIIFFKRGWISRGEIRPTDLLQHAFINRRDFYFFFINATWGFARPELIDDSWEAEEEFFGFFYARLHACCGSWCSTHTYTNSHTHCHVSSLFFCIFPLEIFLVTLHSHAWSLSTSARSHYYTQTPLLASQREAGGSLLRYLCKCKCKYLPGKWILQRKGQL